MDRISGSRRGSAPTRTNRTDSRVVLIVEVLEGRIAPAVLTPVQVRHAYGFDQITFAGPSGQAVRGDGSGQTIAIISAYDHARIQSDLDTFDRAFSIDGKQTLYTQYGAASKFLTVAKPQGQPLADSSGLWLIETALDVQWAHAIAPGASILLVEARSNSFYDLMGAVDYARKQPGVVVVSMSWGANEFVGETSYDGYFTTPTGHLGGSNGLGGPRLTGGVTFVAASGDHGAPATWPATSVNVLAVGGTTLKIDAYGNYLGETAWTGSGGGYSTQEKEPAYQLGVQKTGKRSTPDVSYDADPSTSFYVYSSYKLNGYSGWFAVGGTSAGAPQWAALVAVANQGRALAGKGALDGPTQTLPALYAFAAADFHDIVSGSNGFKAAAGYDPATGRGSPFANRVVKDLVATTIRTAAPTSSTAALPKVTASVLAHTFFVFGTTSAPGSRMAGTPPGLEETVSLLIAPQWAVIDPAVSDLPIQAAATPSSDRGTGSNRIDGWSGLSPRIPNVPGSTLRNLEHPIQTAPVMADGQGTESLLPTDWQPSSAWGIVAVDSYFALPESTNSAIAPIEASLPAPSRPDGVADATMLLIGLALLAGRAGLREHAERDQVRRGIEPWPTR